MSYRVSPASRPSGMCVVLGPAVPVTRTPVIDERRASSGLIVRTTIGCRPARGIAASHPSPLQVQRLLAQASQRGRKIADLLIAAAAEELDLIVLHDDADFDRVSGVTGQRGQWVAPAGSLE